jgi:hypothetical protein
MGSGRNGWEVVAAEGKSSLRRGSLGLVQISGYVTRDPQVSGWRSRELQDRDKSQVTGLARPTPEILARAGDSVGGLGGGWVLERVRLG